METGVIARVLRATAIAVGLALGAIGVVAAPTAALTGVGVGVVAGALVSLMAPKAGVVAALGNGGAARRAGFAVAAVTVWGWLALTGLVAVSGPAGGAVILILLLAAVLGRRRRASSFTGAHPATTFRELSTRQLCEAWRHSHLVLLELPNDSARCPVVQVRHILLDELERRDPDGFTRWLETDAQAGGDPSHHLTTDR